MPDVNPYPKGSKQWYDWQTDHPGTGTTTSTTTQTTTTPSVVDPALLNQTVNRDINQDVTTRGNRDTSQGSITNSTSQTTTRKYVDIPTNEEFLDDFHTGFATYLSGLFHGGKLPLGAANWLMSHESLFLSQYLGELGKMAEAGQPIFKPVGMNGENTYLGSRQGDVTSQTTNTQGQDTTLDHQHGTIVQGTREGSNTQFGVGSSIDANAGQTGLPYDNNDFTSQQERIAGGGQEIIPVTAQTNAPTTGAGFQQTVNTDTNQKTTQDSDITSKGQSIGLANQSNTGTEEMYSRPNLTTVHTLSPLDYLGQHMSPSSLLIMYEGQKNANQAPTTGIPGARIDLSQPLV